MADIGESSNRRTKSYAGCKSCKNLRRRCTQEKPQCAYCLKHKRECTYDTDSLYRHSIQTAPPSKVLNRPKGYAFRPTEASPTLTASSTSTLSNILSTPAWEGDISPAFSTSEPTQGGLDPFSDLFTDDSDMEDSSPFSSPSAAPLSNFLASHASGSSTSPSASENPVSPFHLPASSPDEERSDAYFSFFLSELAKCFPYVNLFPWTAATLFSSSNHHPGLRQSVLAVAALLANRTAQGQAEALDHLQNALSLIRDKISNVEVDEGLAISSFLLSHFSIMIGDHVTAKKHLRGMLIVLQKLNQSPQTDIDVVPSPSNINALTILIWRMAIRIDFICSITSGQRPVLPNLPREQEGAHIEWIKKYADNDFVPDNAAWAEAWFAVDALMHQTCHVSATICELRTRPGTATDTKIRILLEDLNRVHQEWQARKVIQHAREIEGIQQMNELLMNVQIGEQHDRTSLENTTARFLSYAPIRIHNPFVASRLNNWRAAQLHIRLIQDPMWGLYDGARFVCAVDLCRTHAVLGEERTFLGAEKAVGLYLAGVVFGGPDMYEAESEWIVKQLNEMESFYPIASTLSKHLVRVWEQRGNYWEAIHFISNTPRVDELS